MKYDEALRAWGAGQVKHTLREDEVIDVSTVRVELEVEQSYGCSCSSSASAHASIVAYTEGGRFTCYDREYFDFEQFLKEVCEAANGAVTLE